MAVLTTNGGPDRIDRGRESNDILGDPGFAFDRRHIPAERQVDRRTQLPSDRSPSEESFLAAVRRGRELESVATERGVSRGTAFRHLQQERLSELRTKKLDFMPNDEFHGPAAEQKILGPTPEGRTSRTKAPKDLPPYLASLYETPLLNREQETHLFRQYNYLKFRTQETLKGIDDANPSSRVLDKAEEYWKQAEEVRNQIIRANLRLVVSIAKKYGVLDPAFSDRISDGNQSLIRAIEKFDYAKGNKFSTYATWAIQNNMTRAFGVEQRDRTRFRTAGDGELESATDDRSVSPELDVVNSEKETAAIILDALKTLDPREREILVRRYGIGEGAGEKETLEAIGKVFKITKERVRQLERRGKEKLRAELLTRGVDLPFELTDSEARQASELQQLRHDCSELVLDELESGPKSLGELKCLVEPGKEQRITDALSALEASGLIRRATRGIPVFERNPELRFS